MSTEGYQVHIRYKLYLVTFGNDDKSHQNKSHNEITGQLYCKSGIIFWAKSEVHQININLGTNDGQWLNYYFKSVFCIYLLLNYMEIYQNTFKMHL